MLETHGKVEYRCNNCEFVAETEEEVHQHQLSVGHQRTHKCRHCDFTTHWQKNLILHEKRHSETEKYISCEICRKDVPKSTYRRHRERHSRKFTCSTCSKTFPEKGLLKIHTDFTHDNKVLQCSYCDKTFRSYAGYMMHRYVHVSDEHTCKDCDLKFRTKTLLYHHRRKAHLPFKEYTCEVCGKVLESPRSLKDHRKIHMGDEAKVYKCAKCPASFKWAGSLRRHQNSHELLKTCTICRKHYQGTRGLKRHMSTVHKELFES
ncbi:PREDICTED: zinc finger protein 879-like [Branchiostoma belcheri]|uniref:Zinc finger protein 879-like n=1 Tax=Branchiostoma belcheri TaxID=7741 RepID=A0A6P4Z7B6_BRABE|nr:PREDICTED: zinc finger protein 879-like [Branchiostoma belcheri]